jgi:hypothetical protein
MKLNIHEIIYFTIWLAALCIVYVYVSFEAAVLLALAQIISGIAQIWENRLHLKKN